MLRLLFGYTPGTPDFEAITVITGSSARSPDSTPSSRRTQKRFSGIKQRLSDLAEQIRCGCRKHFRQASSSRWWKAAAWMRRQPDLHARAGAFRPASLWRWIYCTCSPQTRRPRPGCGPCSENGRALPGNRLRGDPAGTARSSTRMPTHDTVFEGLSHSQGHRRSGRVRKGTEGPRRSSRSRSSSIPTGSWARVTRSSSARSRDRRRRSAACRGRRAHIPRSCNSCP